MNILSLMKKLSKLRVSKTASKEYEDYIEAAMEHNIALLEEIAKKDGRKTIMKKDVIMLFSKIANKSAGVTR